MPANYQHFGDSAQLLSQQFHLVAVAPSVERWEPSPVLRLRFAVKNGSALETPLSLENLSLTLNGSPVAFEDFEHAHLRVLAEHDRAVKQFIDRQAHLEFGYDEEFGSPGAEPGFENETDPVTLRLRAGIAQGAVHRQISRIEASTRRKLDSLDTLYLRGTEIPGGQTFEGTLEAELPRELEEGDELTLAVNVAPDVHFFKLLISKEG